MAVLHSLIARRRFGPQTQWRPLRKTLTSGLGLDDMSLAWLAVVQLLVFIYSGYSRISHEYSSLFIIVITLIFMFSPWCIDWVGNLYGNRIFMYFCINKEKHRDPGVISVTCSVMIGCIWNLQIRWAWIKSRTSSKTGQIWSLISELRPLDC